jgi:hypothetical protein
VTRPSVVKAIDQKLRYVKDMAPPYAERHVYHVMQGGREYVLKAAQSSNREQRISILREADILRMTADVQGVTHLERNYGVRRSYTAVLKEFGHGKTVYENGQPPIENKFWESLQETMTQLHARGLAQLDIRSRNVVRTPEGTAKIIDLGMANLP